MSGRNEMQHSGLAPRARTHTETREGTTEAAEGEIVGRNGGRLRPWQPGRSGNPGGIGGAYHEARRICAQATPEAARKQVELINSDDDRVSLLATEAVLNRGAGKPRDHSGEQALRVDLSALTADERAMLAALLRKVLST